MTGSKPLPPTQIATITPPSPSPDPFTGKLFPMAWFKKTRKPIAASSKEKASRVPEGLWVKCPGCAQAIYNKDLAANFNVCPKCSHHFRLNAIERLKMLFDGTWTEFDKDLTSTDPLVF